MVGDFNQKVNTVIVALDLTSEVLDHAKNMAAQVIITHPPIFEPTKTFTADMLAFSGGSRRQRNGAYTFDGASDGVSDTLAKTLLKAD